MTPAFEPLWYWLADYYALATCILLATAPALLAIGQPARRLAVGGCALGGLLALLAFSLIPLWPRARLGGFREPSTQPAPTPGPIAARETTIAPDGPRAILAASPARRGERIAEAIEPPARPAPPPNGSGSPARPSWPSMVVAAFLATACVMLAWLAIGWRRLATLRRRSRPAPESARALLARVAGADAAPPALLVSPALRQPVAAGVLRPAILLPEWFLDEPERRLEAALAHEWSHIRNGDLRLIALSRLLLPVLFAHPAYWWLRRRIQDDQEAVADACAAAVEGRLNYAEGLLSWASAAPERPWIAAGGAVALFERTSQLKRRIVMLLGDSRIETTCPKGWRTAARIATAAAVVAASFVTLRPRAVAADSPAPAAVAAARPEESKANDEPARLLDPDGKPFAGAKVYLSPPRAWPKGGPTIPTLLGTTGADGSFRRPRQPQEDGKTGGQVVVTAEGYGPALADPSAKDGEEALKLVRDDVPIQGRVLDVDGRPVAGAKATVVGVLWHPSGKLDEWLEALQAGQAAYDVQHKVLRWWMNDDISSFIPPVVADEDGRFTIRGVGRDRIASLWIEGPGVATTFEYVATRRMPAVKVPDFARQNYSHDITYYGAEFDLVGGPELVAVGTVTDKDTGAPLVGATVGTAALFGNPFRTIKTTTDAQGRYRLAGIPPRTDFNDDEDLLVEPPDDLPYVPTLKHLGKGDGAKPIVVDLQLKRGVRVKGRVYDKSTGEGVRVGLDYFIQSDNPNLKSYPRYGTIRAGMPHQTDEEGNFDLIVMPGPGVIGARAWKDDYRLGTGLDSIQGLEWTSEKQDLAATEPMLLVPKNYHTVRGINPKPGDDTVTCEITLDRGRSVKGRVVDPDGSPLAGAYIEGLEDYFRDWSYKPMPSAEFLVKGIGEGASRDLLVYHEGRKLAGAYVIGPDEAGPITIKLEPCGAVTGRLVEGGRPMADVEMSCFAPSKDAKHEAGSLPGVIKTDGDGRFQAQGLVPGRKYNFRAWRHQKERNSLVDVVKDVVVSRGETKDLGDLPLEGDK